MGIFSSFFGCNQKPKPIELIELTSNQEIEGWNDLIFSITEKEKLNNGFWSLTCKAKHENQIVGIKINIADAIPAGFLSNGPDNTSFASKSVEFESIGIESDNLIRVMSELYEQPIKTSFRNDKLTVTSFPLNDKKAVLKNGRFQFKLFFDDNDEQNLYSEIFLNPDLKNGTIELNEKDEDYRKNIILILAE